MKVIEKHTHLPCIAVFPLEPFIANTVASGNIAFTIARTESAIDESNKRQREIDYSPRVQRETILCNTSNATKRSMTPLKRDSQFLLQVGP